MKMYEVLNGYQGDSYIRCLVIAEDEETAIEKARIEYEKAWTEQRLKHDTQYYTELQTYLVCDDVSRGYVSKINDGYTLDI